MKSLYTFDFLWFKFHEINHNEKIRKFPSKVIYETINCEGKKKELLNNIEKTNLNFYDWLKNKLNK